MSLPIHLEFERTGTKLTIDFRPDGSGEVAITRFARTVTFTWTAGGLRTAESWSNPPASKPER